MKTLFAVLASASILAAPLAASAQDHRGDRGDRGGQAYGGGAAAQAPAQPAPADPGRGGFRGAPQQGGFDRRGAPAVQQSQQQPQQRNFGGGDRSRGFAGGQPNWGGQARDGDRRDYGRGDGDRGGFQGRDYRQAYAYRGYDRGYDRAFRWGVGAFLPRTYWNAYIDPYAYGLGQAPYGYHWVLVEGEALLIDNYTGAIVQEFFL